MKMQTRAEQERDKALLSLDRNKILVYCKKYRIPLADHESILFWVNIHKARLHLSSLPNQARYESARWLRMHGYPVAY